MTGLFTMPPAGMKIARAKAQLKRDDTSRGIESLLAGLAEFAPQGLTRNVRFGIEVSIQECVQELNRQPALRKLLEKLANGKPANINYVPGQEKKLIGLLSLLFKALSTDKVAKEQEVRDKRESRKQMLLRKGAEYINAGEGPRGKSALRLLAEEFGKDPGVLSLAAELLLKGKFYFEAAEILEQAITVFPKESKAYALAAQVYLMLNEYEKGEKVYLKAIKQFGKHPRTLLNLAKLYKAWNKKEEAFIIAQEAYSKDASLEEARAIVEQFL